MTRDWQKCASVIFAIESSFSFSNHPASSSLLWNFQTVWRYWHKIFQNVNMVNLVLHGMLSHCKITNAQLVSPLNKIKWSLTHCKIARLIIFDLSSVFCWFWTIAVCSSTSSVTGLRFMQTIILPFSLIHSSIMIGIFLCIDASHLTHWVQLNVWTKTVPETHRH